MCFVLNRFTINNLFLYEKQVQDLNFFEFHIREITHKVQ